MSTVVKGGTKLNNAEVVKAKSQPCQIKGDEGADASEAMYGHLNLLHSCRIVKDYPLKDACFKAETFGS